ncbi:MAG: phosphoribosylanthranilate isomerase [Hyphomicrobiales bacterium]|nr:phosphoribosylanthranilate isomerase [Hyphomicrobiales bacterium]
MARATPLVKICGLSTPETVEAALAAGADMVGFVFFAKSPRNVAPETAGALAAPARGRARVVALTVDADDALIEAIGAALAPDLHQLHGRESPARAAAIRDRSGVPAMKALAVAARTDVAAAEAYADAVERILFDAKPPRDSALPGGNGRAFDWSLLAGYAGATPWMLSGGLGPDNVAEAIRISGAREVDVSSGVESAPGVKDVGLIRAFVAAAKAARG